MNGGRGDGEEFGRLFQRQTAEDAELRDLRLPGVQCRQAVENFVHI